MGFVVVSSEKKRHSRWYEIVVFNPFFQFCVAAIVTLILPSLFFTVPGGLGEQRIAFQSAFVTAFLASGASFFTLYKLRNYPGSYSLNILLPITFLYWFVAGSAAAFMVPSLLKKMFYILFFLNVSWMAIGWVAGKKYHRPKLAVVPFGDANEFFNIDEAEVFALDDKRQLTRRFDAIVADLYSSKLDAQWLKFLTDCTLAGIPVYNAQLLLESLTGKVRVDHLSENLLGTLQPSPVYEFFKRFLDVVGVILLSFIWVPLMLFVALLIKIESPGAAFFVQSRVGKGGKNFNVYKLRSMRIDSENKGAQFAGMEDDRVTRIGRFIRKMRIDELPQFINVLKGDMSIIGPRPEQKVFVESFEQKIPFYSFRHAVRPGITGWAQVTQGYAADAEETKTKLQYDLYYIKNYSFFLDVVVTLKTIRTILTGFGAR